MKQCPICTAEFTPKKMGQKGCSPICQKEIERQRKILKQRKLALRTRTQWLKEAQIEFNRYIRERDSALPCISCGRFHAGSYDAGHYRSIGAAPQLRFHEDNCWKQCVPCNQHKSGNSVEYRIRLVERIGVERVEALERDNSVRKYTIEEAQAIKAEYRAKLKALDNAQVQAAAESGNAACSRSPGTKS